MQSSVALWSGDDSQDWMWGFHEQLSYSSAFLIPSSLCYCNKVHELVFGTPILRSSFCIADVLAAVSIMSSDLM